MIDLGVPVGIPKLHFHNGTERFITGGEGLEQAVVSMEHESCKVEKYLFQIQNKLEEEDGQNEDEACLQNMSFWLPYSLGSAMGHPEMISPNKMRLWKPSDSNREKVSASSLARKFHQLYPFLPINAADQIKDRLKRKMKTWRPFGEPNDALIIQVK